MIESNPDLSDRPMNLAQQIKARQCRCRYEDHSTQLLVTNLKNVKFHEKLRLKPEQVAPIYTESSQWANNAIFYQLQLVAAQFTTRSPCKLDMDSDFTEKIDAFLKGHSFANLIIFANEADAHASPLLSLAQTFRKIAQF